MIIDKRLIKKRFETNFKRYNVLASVQQQICSDISARLALHCGCDFKRGYEVGAGTGFLTRHLLEFCPNTKWYLNDLSPAAAEFLDPFASGFDVEYLWGDAEKTPFPEELDLIASASTVQWFDDMTLFLRNAYNALNPDGLLALSTFGKDNFTEIHELTGDGLDYYDEFEFKKILRRIGFKIDFFDNYCRTLWFDTPVDVLHHIRATGVNAISGDPWTKGRLAQFEGEYHALFGDKETLKIPLTYNPMIVIAHK